MNHHNASRVLRTRLATVALMAVAGLVSGQTTGKGTKEKSSALCRSMGSPFSRPESSPVKHTDLPARFDADRTLGWGWVG